MADTTLRNYISQDEVERLCDITITSSTEAKDHIELAEETIDNWVGYQEKHFEGQCLGTFTAVNGNDLQDISSDSSLDQQDNYFANCVVEIIGGKGAGQIRRIASSMFKIITVAEPFTTEPDSTSVYRIYQLAKFPRCKDVYIEPQTLTYYKTIPEKVKLAVAAQIDYQIQMGDDYFKGADTDSTSESIGNYSYSNGGIGSGGSQTARVRQISPKARAILNGITNRKGHFEED